MYGKGCQLRKLHTAKIFLSCNIRHLWYSQMYTTESLPRTRAQGVKQSVLSVIVCRHLLSSARKLPNLEI